MLNLFLALYDNERLSNVKRRNVLHDYVLLKGVNRTTTYNNPQPTTYKLVLIKKKRGYIDVLWDQLF